MRKLSSQRGYRRSTEPGGLGRSGRPGRSRPSRGFTVFWIIVTIPMIMMTVAALSRLLIFDAKRTRQTTAQVQVHQMLLAATTCVSTSGQLKPDEQIQLDPQSLLPAELRNQGAVMTLKIIASKDNRVQIRITATLDKYKANQTLIFEKREDQFVLVETRLND
jgi:hypothetical protein